MSQLKLLIDTNILIAAEDPGSLDPRIASLFRQCTTNNVSINIEDSSFQDLEHDLDANRRTTTISRAQRFARLKGIHHRTDAELAGLYGPIRRANDRVDVRLLDTVGRGIADILVTEDVGMHQRASNAGIAERVLTVDEALTWLQKTFEPKLQSLPTVDECLAYQINTRDPFFESLCIDYPDFPRWYQDKCIKQHRHCWVARIDGSLAGLVIRKAECRADSGVQSPGERVLKICTFKVNTPHQGEKLGEQLLKQVLWFAQSNRFETVYATAFPKHTLLIALFESFGFHRTSELPNGEILIEKVLTHGDLPSPAEGVSVVVAARHVYPRYYEPPTVAAFIVPIQAGYHRRLFPEIAPPAIQADLFPQSQELLPGRPGNTIRKVYLCRASTQALVPGSLLLFYHSKGGPIELSQTITTLGVLESTAKAETLTELQRITARRSAFSVQQLGELMPTQARPLRVLDFLLIGHLLNPIRLTECVRRRVFSQRPPQSIMSISADAFNRIRELLRVSHGG
jgi:predicted nucleic acid-binding protein/L-amino acid N-acyltransferase YncA